MSSGAECYFAETKKGWVLGLQCWPYGDTEEYDRYGPFKTFAAAYAELNTHQNPGGFSINSTTEEGKLEQEKFLTNCQCSMVLI